MNFPFHLKSKGTNQKAQLETLILVPEKSNLDFEDPKGEVAGWLAFCWPPLQPDPPLLPHLLFVVVVVHFKDFRR